MHNLYILHDYFEIAVYRNKYKYIFPRFSKNIEKSHDEKLAIKLSQRSQIAFRCTYSDPRTESNRTGKSNVTYHAPLRPKARAFSQYSGATSKMQPAENSWLARRNRISLSHRNRCVSLRLFPRGESKRRRSLVLEGETFL